LAAVIDIKFFIQMISLGMN